MKRYTRAPEIYQLSLENLGREEPAFRRAVNVGVETHDSKAVFDGGAVEVRVVEVQIESRCHLDE